MKIGHKNHICISKNDKKLNVMVLDFLRRKKKRFNCFFVLKNGFENQNFALFGGFVYNWDIKKKKLGIFDQWSELQCG